jgi:glycosyltransferase involved in cell wall biosynthesis
MKTGIVITFYNKEKNIDLDQMELFLNSCNNIQVCFVNNGSTDNTIDTLEQISEKFPEIVSVVNIKNNKGEESALKVGLILLLDEFGYPPVDKDEVYVEIFEQAENFKKNN